METLQISKTAAQEAHKKASQDGKTLLEDLLGKSNFLTKITDRIKTFEDACEYNNTNPLAKRFTQGTRNQIFQERVAEIVKALNEGWVPDYDDDDEYKYGPWFALDEPGFRFGVTYCDCASANSPGGSRFALKTRDLAVYAGTHFVKEYENWLMPDPTAADDQATPSTPYTPAPFSGTMAEWEKHIMSKVTSFETACAEVGEDPADEKFREGEADEISYKKGKVVVRALNGPHLLNWKDRNQAKWHAWLEHDGTGFRFCAALCGYSGTGAAGGSRLRLCSSTLAKYFATQFPDLMMPFWL